MSDSLIINPEKEIILIIQNNDATSFLKYFDESCNKLECIDLCIKMSSNYLFDQVIEKYDISEYDCLATAVLNEDQYFLKKLLEIDYPFSNYKKAIDSGMRAYDLSGEMFLLDNIRLILRSNSNKVSQLDIFLLIIDNPYDAIYRLHLLFDVVKLDFDKDAVQKVAYYMCNMKPEYFSFLLSQGMDQYAEDVANKLVNIESLKYRENIDILLEKYHGKIKSIELSRDLIEFIIVEGQDGSLLLENIKKVNKYGIEIRLSGNQLRNIGQVFQLCKSVVD